MATCEGNAVVTEGCKLNLALFSVFLGGGGNSVPLFTVGRDSSVGIATRYGLDGPGIESRWRQDFPHPSTPALGPTQSSIQWVPGLSRG